MLNKIKFLGIIFLSIILLTNCNKDNKQDPTKQGELVFAAMDVVPDKGDDPLCNDQLTVVYAHVVIDNISYYPLTFVLDNKLYTQAIKLDEKVGYELQYFALMDDMGTPDKGDDVIVKAAPGVNSDYGDFVTYTLPKLFDIIAFQKFELRIEVLCYIPAVHTYFGFFWFEVIEITIREQCFFGDFCIKSVSDYWGSLYGGQGDVKFDEIAIFKIKIFSHDVLVDEFDNELTYGDGLPLCVEYADYDRTFEDFRFELWIYVKVGPNNPDGSGNYDYVLFHTWDFLTDDYMIPTHNLGEAVDDGVVDFILGNCGYEGTPPNLLLPPWMNLPDDIAFTIVQFPGNTSYFDILLGSLPAGFDITAGTYAAWCADKFHTIGVGPTYCMDARSSLYPAMLPAPWNTPVKIDQIGRVNYLFNHLDDLGPYNKYDMQDALWHIFDGVPILPGSVAQGIVDAAVGHGDFTPLPAGYCAVFFIECNGVSKQITFRQVDP